MTAGGAPVAYRERLAVAEAVAAVLAEGAPPGAGPGAALGSEVVPLADAVGRVLAQDVAAPAHVPPWPNASMDGYAVRAADVRGAGAGRPVALRVAATAYAAAQGSDRGATGPVGPGAAVRIATGAPVPDGADAVVRVEDTRPDPGDPARVLVVDDRDARDDAPGGGGARRNVRPAGEDVRAGGVAVAAGTRVTPGVAGLLAAVGAARVAVARRPRVAIIASGDELVPLDRAAEAHAGRAVVSANSVTLAALVREAGGEPVDLGIAPDAEPAVRALFVRARALACDVVLTTGGVSVGERDHVRPAAAAAGGHLHFWRVRLRPGGPLAFGTLPAGDGGRRVPWLGLPGNPVSTVVTFALFVRPLLAALQGDRRPYPAPLPAVLAEPVRTAAALTHLLRATLEPGAGGRLVARLTGPQGSGLLSSVARADAYVVVPEPARALAAGAPVWALPAGAWASAAAAWPPGLWDAPPADAPAPNAAEAPG